MYKCCMKCIIVRARVNVNVECMLNVVNINTVMQEKFQTQSDNKV